MSSEVKVEEGKLLDMFRMMVRIRKFENQANELAKRGLTRAVVHTYIGQEAIATGVCAALNQSDYITSTHRGHGHCIAKGAKLQRMYAELLGKTTGYCKGKGGSMHIADLDTGNLGANGIVGGGIPMAMGAGLGSLLSNNGNVAVSFFGDGASNQGSFHEALNMAAVWKLPVIFVCENNKYGISSHISNTIAIDRIAERAKAYGMPGETIDGNNVIEVYKTIEHYVTKAKNGEGPVLIEADTYRISGHYFGDLSNYRDKSEIDEWKKKDPILNCRKVLLEEYNLNEEILDQIIQEEEKHVIEASESAKLDPDPDTDDLIADLYNPTFEKIEWV